MTSAAFRGKTTVLFDLDGTVVHSVPLIIDSYKATLKAFELAERSEEEIATWIGLTLDTVWADLGLGDPVEPTAFYRQWNDSRHDESITPCPGVPQLLQELKAAGLDRRVVTSKGRALAERGLEILGIDDMEVLVGKEDTDKHKPNPEPLLRALELLGRPAEECIYIGDATYDVQCAHAAGMEAIAVTWGAGVREKLEEQNPLAVVDTVDELKAILLGT